MADPFALKTADPAFNPRQPVTVNGYLFLPADHVHLEADEIGREFDVIKASIRDGGRRSKGSFRP